MSLKDFYIRRFSRVIPALVVFLLASLAVALLLNYEFKPVELLASLVFVRTYFPADPVYYSTVLPTGHLWSLSVEEHSYIIMSILSVVLIAHRKIVAFLFSLFLLSVFICWYNYLTIPASEFEATLIRTETAIGFIAFSAGYNLLIKRNNLVLNGYVPVVCVFLAFACYVRLFPIWLTFTLCPVLLGVAINHLLQSTALVRRLFCFAPLRWFGVLSYSIYLWQQIFYKLYYALPGGALTAFLLSLIAGAGSFFLIENPARRYINTKWSKTPSNRRA